MNTLDKQNALGLVVTLNALFALCCSTGAYGQTGTCGFNTATNQCVIQGGNTCAVGDGVGTSCAIGENACWCVLPGFTLSVTPPVSANYASSTGPIDSYKVAVTPAPGGGSIGTVTFRCTTTPFTTVGVAGPTCSFVPATVKSTGAQVISTLFVKTPPGIWGNSTITVFAQEQSSSAGPTNGPQSVTLEIAQQTAAGGSIALLTFIGLVALWSTWSWLGSRRVAAR